jgi:hypothetical protein
MYLTIAGRTDPRVIEVVKTFYMVGMKSSGLGCDEQRAHRAPFDA